MKKYVYSAIAIQALVISVIFCVVKSTTADSVATNKQVVVLDNGTDTNKPVKPSAAESKQAQNKVLASKAKTATSLSDSTTSDNFDSLEESMDIYNIDAPVDANHNAPAKNNNSDNTADNKPKSEKKANSPKDTNSNNKVVVIVDNAHAKEKVVTIVDNEGESKQIKLLDIDVPEEKKQELISRAKNVRKDIKDRKDRKDNKDRNDKLNNQLVSINAPNNFIISNDIGMANVPVLDQGLHGTCVTFATTAILNAKMNAGDYISQQCVLELGRYINTVSKCANDGCSGWKGLSSNGVSLSRIKQYGIVSKDLCPHQYANASYSLTYQQYLDLSSKLWADSFNYKKLAGSNLAAIKTAINNNNRVAIAILLHSDYIAGVAINGKPNGLWSIAYNAEKFVHDMFYNAKLAGGHALVVTGYDDAKRLLKVRNSWSAKVGDSGEFYITYDYYQLLGMEAFEVY